MKKNSNLEDSSNVKKDKSFIEKVKTDKKYSAKVQLIGYGVLLLVLVIYLNIANMGNNTSQGNNTIIDSLNSVSEVENTDEDASSLLESITDNYSYDMTIEVERKNIETDEVEEVTIYYRGKSYGNQLEINKMVGSVNSFYYKVDGLYYSKNDNTVNFVKEGEVYNIIDGEYIELDDIIKLMAKASLDRVTDYSSGKKEYVYNLKVRDVIVSYQKDDIVEIDVEEENGILKIDIDYSNLFKAMDDSILECELEAVITDIGEIDDFVVLEEGEENTSVE